MNRIIFLIAVCGTTAGLSGVFVSTALGQSLESQLATVNSIGNLAQGHEAAAKAWRTLGRAPVSSLPELLKGIQDGKPLAANWIRAAVDQVAERAVSDGRKLPAKELEAIVFDPQYSPRARRLAYEWLLQVDASAKDRIIPKMLNDTSLEMRRDAVALTLKKAAAADGDKQAASSLYRVALTSARDSDQIDAAYDKLVELGQKIDLPTHFGFLTAWKLIGPFENAGSGGFDVAYPPEKAVTLNQSYRGKVGDVKWIDHQTGDKYGMVNLNEALGKHMGAIGYAYTEFESTEAKQVDLRVGCICAVKLWLNGEQLLEREVYHSGTKIDQYVTRGKLVKGKNTILLKVCQNEQTESWAQDWEFQIRVCDSVGTAVLAKNRPAPVEK